MFIKHIKFMFPFLIGSDTIGDIGGGKEPMGPEDDLKFLRSGEPEAKEDESEEETQEEEQEETEEESTEDESNESEDTEDTEEDTEEPEPDEELPGALVTAKDLKEKYPDIFKKIPELKGIIYRERQYSEIFADPKEAQSAQVSAQSFQEMSNDLLSGNTTPLIEAIKKSGDDAYSKFVSNFLPSLEKVDEPTFMKVVAPVFKRLLRSAFRSGNKNNDKNLALSAQHLHNFIFENTNLDEKADFEKEATKANPEEDKYKKKLEELDQRDHNNFKQVVDNEWLSGVETAFKDGLDPDGTMSKWMKDKLFEATVMELNKQLASDPRHMKNMEGLWRQGKANGYASNWKSRIVNAALDRAKQILPTVRAKLKKEALAREGKAPKVGEKKSTMKVAPRVGEKKPQAKNPKSTESMSELDIIRG